MAKILLSYPPQRQCWTYGRIFDHGSARFGSGRVFRMWISTRVKTRNRAKLLVSQPPISKHLIWLVSGPWARTFNHSLFAGEQVAPKMPTA